MSGYVAHLSAQRLSCTDGIKKLTGVTPSAFKGMGSRMPAGGRVGLDEV